MIDLLIYHKNDIQISIFVWVYHKNDINLYTETIKSVFTYYIIKYGTDYFSRESDRNKAGCRNYE